MNKSANFLLVFVSLLITSFSARASTIQLSEAAGQVEVYLQNGTQISTTYTSPLTSTTVGNNIALRFGTFTGGFTPTYDNSSSWFSNFVGVNGYVTVLNAASNAGKMSASIGGGDNNSISAPVTSNSGVGANGSASIAKDSKLYAIFWNAPYVANGSTLPTTTGGNTFYPTPSGTADANIKLQAAILQNDSWIMPLTGGQDTTITTYSLSAGTTALIGSLDLANKGVTLYLIPEPNSVVTLTLGLAFIFKLRRSKRFIQGNLNAN